MRIIAGYICLAQAADSPMQYPFGQSTSSDGYYNSFLSNDLTPFVNQTEVEKAERTLRELGKFTTVLIKDIKISIAETASDLYHLRNSTSLIVIATSHFAGDVCHDLYGEAKSYEKSAHPLPAALLTLNGFKPFRTMQEAKYCGSEVRRQAGCQVRIARFSLRKPKFWPG